MIEFAVSIELAAVLLTAVGAVGTWLHGRQKKEDRAQSDRHHRELRQMRERHLREREEALRRARQGQKV